VPLKDFRCKACGKVDEHFFWPSAGAPVSCECGGELEQLPLSAGTNRKTAVFPFTTTHLDGNGTPITVESLGHLRSLERTYGAVVHGFSNNPGNPDTPRDLPMGRPGGRESEAPQWWRSAAPQLWRR
jgi:hypothetical protein